MKEPGEKYDVVVIGSGLGGLQCGYILSKEGYKVCILEKNKQYGGNLQIFMRDKCVFDTGVHYIGGLSEGQNLNQYFKYFGLMDKLRLKQMDIEGFDRVTFGEEEEEFWYSQGYENFIERMVYSFPGEEKAIRDYCSEIQEVCRSFPLYNLEYQEDNMMETAYMNVGARDFINSLTDNHDLQQVLAGNNGLYAGEGDKTPFYVHALVINTYIDSAWRCVRGGYQIAKFLIRAIKKMGGELYNEAEVEKINVSGKYTTGVRLKSGKEIKSKYVISNAHPATTMKMVESPQIRKAYRNRVNNLENTVSVFSVHIVLKKHSLKYFNHNYYHFDQKNVWNAVNYKEKDWPSSYILVTSASTRTEREEYAESLTVMCYMRYDEVKPWEDTFHTIIGGKERGETYEEFKERKAERVIDKLEKKFPGIRQKIYSYYTSTPLTYRDYIGNQDGNMYGVARDFNDPLKTFISPRTRIPNLLLTGENTNIHGVLGVTVGSVITCSQLLGKKYLLDKVTAAT